VTKQAELARITMTATRCASGGTYW